MWVQLFQQQRPRHGLFHLREEQFPAGLAFFVVVIKVGEAGLAHGWLFVRKMDNGIISF